MKIRICDDSIRLRLDRSEVETIGRGGVVDCGTRFPDGAVFGDRIAVGEVEEVTAGFEAGCIEVVLPTAAAQHWAGDEAEVSIHGVQNLPEGALTLLIEKDFECLEPRAGEDQSNRFENPKALAAS